MKLEILICTLDNGIEKVSSLVLSPMHNVSYLVSWQISGSEINQNVPASLQREDVKVSKIEGIGLSRNRNNAIALATGDVCLIADDDVKYESKYFDRIIEIFEGHPAVDIALFKYQSSAGTKQYPSFSFDLREMPKGYYVSSIEIAFKRQSIQNKLKFNEYFGLGAPVLGAGEESLFVYDALNKNLHCQFFPYIIAVHNHVSTGQKKEMSESTVMAAGAYLEITKPNMLWMRFIRKAQQISGNTNLSFLRALMYLIKGAKYARNNKLA